MTKGLSYSGTMCQHAAVGFDPSPGRTSSRANGPTTVNIRELSTGGGKACEVYDPRFTVNFVNFPSEGAVPIS